MNARRLVLTVGVLLLCLSPLHGQELRSINRTIKKEPAYTTSAPGYALLVFGAKADSSAWMVRDGDVLYFDRNGNGDLTDPEDKVAIAPKSKELFTVGDVAEVRGELHRNLQVIALGEGEFRLRVQTNGKLMQWVGFEPNAPRPKWGATPAKSPVIHLNGPKSLASWNTIRTFAADTAVKNQRDQSLRLKIGTPGLGEGTFASFHCCCRFDSGNKSELVGEVVYAKAGGGEIKEAVEWQMLG